MRAKDRMAALLSWFRAIGKSLRQDFNWKKVSVEFGDNYSENRRLPWEIRDYAELAGALADSKVIVKAYPEVLSFVVQHAAFENPMVFQAVFEGGWETPGHLRLHYLELRRERQGHAIATRLFATQASTAARLGFRFIHANAIHRHASALELHKIFNGSYTVARWGFDAKLNDEQLSDLPPILRHCQFVSEVMKNDSGRDYWRRYGSSASMDFDLLPNSHSWTILHEYLNKTAIRRIK